MNLEYEALKTVLNQPNWETEMENRNITVKWSENREYFLLKYNQLDSDFNDPVVRACRGSIFANTDSGIECVCAPFIKFGNYGESYCPEVDWTSARVLEKIDGSLMKLWFYKGEWHLSTNGTIDANDAEVNDDLSFYELFEMTLKDQFGKTFNEFVSNLTPNFTYMFELTAPENRVVIEYQKRKIWFLSRRDMQDMREDYINDTGVDRPKEMDLRKLETCLSVVAQMSKDHEGVVVNDNHFNRIKIKSPEYLMSARLSNNGQITTKRIITMIKDLTIDDFVAYCDKYTEKVGQIQQSLGQIAGRWNRIWHYMEPYAIQPHSKENRRAFAVQAINYAEAKSFLFHKYDHPEVKAEDFLLLQSTVALKKLIEKELNK